MSLKTRVMKARFELLIIEEEYKEVQQRYDKALNKWRSAVEDIEEADYQQALIDGRMKKVQLGQGKPKPLTIKQIENIAKKLGINLEETKDED